MAPVTPSSAEELASILADAGTRHLRVQLTGHNSKRQMAGPLSPADIAVSTRNLRRVLQYERNDLTLSVEAGMPFSELQSLLAKNGQMIALDPPFWSEATVGGVVASNSSGPLRRRYGTARDLCIGMTFATLNGKLVKSGGMVVKNVAGLDLGKLMIGSFGTLAAITSINFRVHSLPSETSTYLFAFGTIERALERRDELMKSPLQPAAIDLLSPPASARVGRGSDYLLAVKAGGSKAIINRFTRDLPDGERIEGDQETRLWEKIREFAPDFLRRQPGGTVLRIGAPPSELGQMLRLVAGTCVCRAATGVSYAFLSSSEALGPVWRGAHEKGWTIAVEYAPNEVRETSELWQSPSCSPGSDSFVIMERMKAMFDPARLLNPLRLYGRL